jgi:hypothetical protein
MTDPVLIPIAEVRLVTPSGRNATKETTDASEDASESPVLLLLPAGGVSPLSVKLEAARERLAPVFDADLSPAQLIREINSLVDDQLFVTVGAQGWNLGIQRRGTETDAVELDSRVASRISPEATRVTLNHEDTEHDASVMDVSTDGGGCALECDAAALQALLASNMFHMPENDVPGRSHATPVEIEVRSITRKGARFRVGCEVTGAKGTVKKLVS